jgi:hypothetical protein
MDGEHGGTVHSYSLAIAERVCDLVADGYTLREIEREPDMPSRQAIRRWLNQHPTFAVQYARARQEQADGFVDRIHTIIHDKDIDPQRAKIIADHLRWEASKRNRSVYGDKIDVDARVSVSHEEAVNALFGG